MDITQWFKSRWFAWVLAGLGGVIMLLGVFELGVRVGATRGRFPYPYRAEAFHHRFWGQREEGWGRLGGRGMMYPMGHGLSGTVASVTGNSLTVTLGDGSQRTVAVSDQTVIRQGRARVTLDGLKVGVPLVVIGSPQSDGSIAAKIISLGLPGAPAAGVPEPFSRPFVW